MADIRKLIEQIAIEEEQLRWTQFLAPCVRGGRVRTRVAGLVCTFTPQPRNFEGWGIFQPLNDGEAEVVEEADFCQVAEYLQQFPPMRFWLVDRLQGQTWLAYPTNESDLRQRTGVAQPVPIHLVSEGGQFDPVVTRWDGQSWWFEEIDRRADPQPTEVVREALKRFVSPESLRFKGMTPEMKTVYDLVAQRTQAFTAKMQQRREEQRLRDALQMGGGKLQEFRDRRDYWWIEWTAGNGECHTSAIAKTDLTVVSAGICLSGMDGDFDLQSLVGVVERREG